jgi:hypothetical protein
VLTSARGCCYSVVAHSQLYIWATLIGFVAHVADTHPSGPSAVLPTELVTEFGASLRPENVYVPNFAIRKQPLRTADKISLLPARKGRDVSSNCEGETWSERSIHPNVALLNLDLPLAWDICHSSVKMGWSL